jgi:hypothetical protein
MDRLQRIRRAALSLRWVVVVAMVAIAALAVVPLFAPIAEWAGMHGAVTHVDPLTGVSTDPRLTARLSVLPKAVLLYGLYVLVKMLRSCERGDLFSPRQAGYLQQFSVAIVAAQLLYISVPLQIALIHMALGQAHGKIVLIVSSEQLWSLLLAALFMILSSLMREAAAIAQENASII